MTEDQVQEACRQVVHASNPLGTPDFIAREVFYAWTIAARIARRKAVARVMESHMTTAKKEEKEAEKEESDDDMGFSLFD